MLKMKKLEPEHVEDMIALTPLQEGLLFHYIQDPGGSIYFEQLNLYVSGELKRDCFEQAWRHVVQANPALRTVFRWQKISTPLQIVLNDHDVDLRMHDLSTHIGEELDAQVSGLMQKDIEEGFDLHEVPFRVRCIRLSAERHVIGISHHHILYDGWHQTDLPHHAPPVPSALCLSHPRTTAKPHHPCTESLTAFEESLSRVHPLSHPQQ